MAHNTHETDWYAWTRQQAELLRAGRLLLKWQYQSGREESKPSWKRTIEEQRNQLELVLDDSPSLKTLLNDAEWVQKIWSKAVKLASDETKITRSVFAGQPIWTFIQILDTDWLPLGA